MRKRFRQWLARAKQALLGRSLTGRKLERPVRDAQGEPLFEPGREIDPKVLDKARRKDRLEELARAAEPGTSDTEIEDVLVWRKRRRNDDVRPGDR